METARPAILRIGTLRLTGDGLSRVEARRLSDALPAALERAAAAWPDVAPRDRTRAPDLADRIARRIVETAIARSRVQGADAE